MTTPDIVERLRNCEAPYFESSLRINSQLDRDIEEAAAEIERLRAELSSAQSTIIKLCDSVKSGGQFYADFLVKFDEAKAEIERLRAALSPVLNAIKYSDSSVLIDDNFNSESHVDIVLTVAECQTIRDALNPPA